MGAGAMNVDVTTTTRIARPPAEVASYVSDQANAPLWYRNITSVRRETEPPLRIGSRFRFTARFMGKSLRYTYEVTELTSGRLVMGTTDGSFAMQTTYTFERDGRGTRMTLRNTGAPAGPQLLAPLVEARMRRANRTDLADLRRILEAREEGAR
jgi:uncharacterized protein YndB with AHSA1/START domain